MRAPAGARCTPVRCHSPSLRSNGVRLARLVRGCGCTPSPSSDMRGRPCRARRSTVVGDSPERTRRPTGNGSSEPNSLQAPAVETPRRVRSTRRMGGEGCHLLFGVVGRGVRHRTQHRPGAVAGRSRARCVVSPRRCARFRTAVVISSLQVEGAERRPKSSYTSRLRKTARSSQRCPMARPCLNRSWASSCASRPSGHCFTTAKANPSTPHPSARHQQPGRCDSSKHATSAANTKAAPHARSSTPTM